MQPDVVEGLEFDAMHAVQMFAWVHVKHSLLHDKQEFDAVNDPDR